jgi:hypothetical protein
MLFWGIFASEKFSGIIPNFLQNFSNFRFKKIKFSIKNANFRLKKYNF